MYQVEYTALKYYNSIISDECLYVGMLYNNITTGQRDFRYISNFSRFKAFDNEANIDFIKAYLKGIKDETENNIFNYQNFNIKEFTKIFVNEFRFTDIMKIEVDESENYVENLTKLYLKFDFNKKDRLNNKTEKQYIKQILSSKGFGFSSPKIKGNYDEEISFDYVINNVAVKIFSFRDKNLKKVIPTAKQWSFNAKELEEITKIIFIYDNSETKDNAHLDIILNILKENALVFQLPEGLDYISKNI